MNSIYAFAGTKILAAGLIAGTPAAPATVRVITSASIINTTNANVNFSAYIVPDTGTAGDDNVLIKVRSVGPNQTDPCSELVGKCITPGATLRVFGEGVTLTYTAEVHGDSTASAPVGSGSRMPDFDSYFGGDPTDTNDSAEALRLSLEYCYTNKIRWSAPEGKYRLDSPVVAHAPPGMSAAGKMNTLFRYNGPAGEVPITLTIDAPHVAGKFEDFGIESVVLGASENALVIKLMNSSAYFAHFSLENLYLSDCRMHGLVLDNSIANGDGFFVGTVEGCLISNSIQIVNGGDSLNILRNCVSPVSSTIGATCAGIEMTGVSGARQLVVSGNNFSTGGGAVHLTDVEEPTVQNNQCEHPWYRNIAYTGAAGAMMYFKDCLSPKVYDNTINPGSASSSFATAAFAIKFDGTTKHGIIKGNEIFKGTSGHIRFEAGAYANVVGKNTYPVGYDPVISMANPMLYPQIGIELPLNLINGWISDPLTGYSGATVRFNEDGTGEFFGAVVGGSGVVANMPSQIVTKFARAVTPAQGLTTAFSLVQIDPGAGQPLQIPASPGNYASLTGLRFPYRFSS